MISKRVRRQALRSNGAAAGCFLVRLRRAPRPGLIVSRRRTVTGQGALRHIPTHNRALRANYLSHYPAMALPRPYAAEILLL